MTKCTSLTRREFLRLSSLGAGALLLTACGQKQLIAPTFSPKITSTPRRSAQANPLHAQTVSPGAGDVVVSLTAAPATVKLLPGEATRVWQYQGQIIQGDSGALQNLSNSYLGPILRLQKGQNLKLQYRNQIPDASIVHWHGLKVPDVMDGHPRFAIQMGQTYEYEYIIANRAGTYWYHPHPHGRTGPQAYYGLAGLMIVSDEEEAALGLPAGDFDLPLVIQDRSLDNQNQLVYFADTMNGFFGDQVLVNGQAQHTWIVQSRPHRLRLLNGSNARIYKLAWDDNTPLTVIASDGGLLEKPVERPYITLAPGERVEIWADFSPYRDGQNLRLRSLPFSIRSGMMGGVMGNGGLANGASLDVLNFQVKTSPEQKTFELPEDLSTPGFYDPRNAANWRNPRMFTLAMHMAGTINGRTFVMEDIDSNEIVHLGDLEIWEFYNSASGMGMMGGGMPHPMHIHGVQFQVIKRQIDRQNRQDYESINDGFVDEGWKDTVLVWPGERVRVLVRFDGYPGLFLYHCHNLEHEDGGMMRNYRVES